MIKLKNIFDEAVNKKDAAYKLAIDYTGNTKPEITKFNKKGMTVYYGYKVNPKDVIKSLVAMEPTLKIRHVQWSSISTGGGTHEFMFEGKKEENELFVKKEDIGCFTEGLIEAGKHISEAEYQGRRKEKMIKLKDTLNEASNTDTTKNAAAKMNKEVRVIKKALKNIQKISKDITPKVNNAWGNYILRGINNLLDNFTILETVYQNLISNKEDDAIDSIKRFEDRVK